MPCCPPPPPPPAPLLQIAGHVLKQHCYRDSADGGAAARELDIRELQDK
jgi:hypothetical protein